MIKWLTNYKYKEMAYSSTASLECITENFEWKIGFVDLFYRKGIPFVYWNYNWSY